MRASDRTCSMMTITRGMTCLALWFVSTADGVTAANKPVKAGRVEVEQQAGGFTMTQSVRVPAEVRTDYERAVRLLEEGKYEPGIALLLEVIARAPALTAAHIDLGMAYARVGDLDHAEASLRQALELNPEHPVAWNELGMV